MFREATGTMTRPAERMQCLVLMNGLDRRQGSPRSRRRRVRAGFWTLSIRANCRRMGTFWARTAEHRLTAETRRPAHAGLFSDTPGKIRTCDLCLRRLVGRVATAPCRLARLGLRCRIGRRLERRHCFPPWIAFLRHGHVSGTAPCRRWQTTSRARQVLLIGRRGNASSAAPVDRPT
jgi:hypothetical protein